MKFHIPLSRWKILNMRRNMRELKLSFGHRSSFLFIKHDVCGTILFLDLEILRFKNSRSGMNILHVVAPTTFFSQSFAFFSRCSWLGKQSIGTNWLSDISLRHRITISNNSWWRERRNSAPFAFPPRKLLMTLNFSYVKYFYPDFVFLFGLRLFKITEKSWMIKEFYLVLRRRHSRKTSRTRLDDDERLRSN